MRLAGHRRINVGLHAVANMASVALILAGCTGSHKGGPAGTPTPGKPMSVAWREVTLPAPAGGPGRLALRDATSCAGRWYAVGGVIAADGGSRPAAWTSRDGRAWTSLPLNPRTYYGQQAVFYAAGCRDGLLAALGTQTGGVHSNPRFTQWRLRADGTLDEVLARFELYGGPDAVNVGRITGGPAGWLITGNRVAGAAVWVSADASAFQLVTGAAQLASDGELATQAMDAVAYQKEWVVVGSGRSPGRTGSDPAVFTSADGLSWRRGTVHAEPAASAPTDRYAAMQRIIGYGQSLVAAGVDGDRFGAWVSGPDGWRPAGQFGSLIGGSIQEIRGLAATGGGLWAAGTDGSAFGLWNSADGGSSWRPVQTPLGLAAGGADHTMTVAGAGSDLLLLADDGRAGRAWLAGS
jgi:hypothetical protein